MPSDAAGPVADTVTPTLMSCASAALAPTAARRVANSLVVNFMSLLFFYRWNGGRRKVSRANAVGKRMRTKSDPFNKQGNALPDADAHRGTARSGRRSRPAAARRSARSAPPTRRAGDRARSRRRSGSRARRRPAGRARRGDRQALRGEGLVQLDHVDVARPSVRAAPAASREAGAGPMPMIRGGTPAVAAPTDAGDRRQPVPAPPRLRSRSASRRRRR